MSQADVVVYTAICGGYDALRAALAQTVACDFVALTDGELPGDQGWQVRALQAPASGMPARLVSRWPKATPHQFFDRAQYRYAIWVDGSLEVLSATFVADMLAALRGQVIGAFPHPQRECIYEEAQVCQPLQKYADYDLAGQVATYQREGYPAQHGLPACTVLVWDLRHPRQAEAGNRWWAEQRQWGTMDQLALPVVLWRMGLDWAVLPGHLWRNPWFRLWEHQGAARDELRLNLGCADRMLEGFVNVDITPGPGVTVADLRGRWPWADGSVQRIVALDVIEHLPDKIHTLNEMHRVLCAGCVAEILVPSTEGPGAWQDPTHVSFWNRNSFRYYTAGDPYRERFARGYGITAAFKVMGEERVETPDGPKVYIALAAVK